MSHSPDAAPFNPLPAVVWLLAAPIVAVELVFGLAGQGLIGGPQAIGWRTAAIERFAFSDTIFDWMLANGVYPPEYLVRFVSYVFVHLSFSHALFAVVLLLALGKMVAEVFRPWAVLVVFFGSAIVGAAAYGVLLNEPRPLIGAFPAVYGLIGAFTFLLRARLGAVGANRTRAFTLIAVLMGIQLVFGLLFGGSDDWVADLAGFGAGFGLSFLVAPGAWRRARARLRQR